MTVKYDSSEWLRAECHVLSKCVEKGEARLREANLEIGRLRAQIEKYQACRVHDVDEKEWLRDQLALVTADRDSLKRMASTIPEVAARLNAARFPPRRAALVLDVPRKKVTRILVAVDTLRTGGSGMNHPKSYVAWGLWNMSNPQGVHRTRRAAIEYAQNMAGEGWVKCKEYFQVHRVRVTVGKEPK